ncbi:non-ribosomal peptide synthetase/type I polyketide synthase [Myxococcus landrumensis]|uniref:Amino acid adenylation domain-containing protein n=1 Tax=Myxococcus landrumensis TaxID=2813577 RepID=A0ABX7N8U2_9BACT|nr:non-ribosomal peptide synthetase/type I polyketide synthase [Myxococcus landrumus]QSQ14848.1 amino acid adenylation domain-containing protein [Myxococcus landrumus]
MNATELIAELKRLGVVLEVEDEHLRVRAARNVLTSELQKNIAARKAELLTLLREPPSRAELSHEPFPLTDIQEAYLVGRGTDFGVGGVSCHVYHELDGQGLDLGRLSRAWQRLIDQHPMLRAVVLPSGEQRVLERVPPYSIPELDLRGQPPEVVEAKLAEIRRELSTRTSPPGQWPTFELRATLLGAGRTRIHIDLDAITMDGASMLALSEEWRALYAEPEQRLDPVPVTFREHVLAEAAARNTSAYRSAESYWTARLDDLPDAPVLPLATSPEHLDRPAFRRLRGTLDASRWSRLKQLGAEAGLTRSGIVCAAFAEVMATWSESRRFTLNLTLFQRPPIHPAIDRVVGDFTTNVLLEMDGKGQTFRQRAVTMRDQLAQDFEHVRFSGVRVLRERAKRRRGPGALMPIVFTSLLGHRPTRPGGGFLFGWLGEKVHAITQTPQVWLDHQVHEDDGALCYCWDSPEGLFPAGLLEDAFSALSALLVRLADEPAAWDEPAPVRLPAAQSARRESYNATTAPIPATRLDDLFLEQAMRSPERIAVFSEERTLTYAQLRGHAGALAERLLEAGARPGELVAVLLEKGWRQVVAVLGIHLAGAAYLPIEPSLPEERHRLLLQEGRVRVVVTDSPRAERFSWPEGTRVLTVPDAAEGRPPRLPSRSASDLAYCIYTSGSTGRPKGVMIDHRGAVNTVLDMNERFRVGPEDRVFALSSLSFDLSVYDVFGTLAAGAAIVMPAPGMQRDPGHWLSMLEQGRVSVWNSVPALMEMLIEYLEGEGLRLPDSLRLVWMSGDWIPLPLPDRIRARGRSVETVSLGGATEASIWSILHRIGDVDRAWRSIPYGTPMVNQRFHVLDAALEPRPEWVTGQLYIGGSGLALGYFGDAERTARRFIIHPRTGERLYATGDLGRFLPEGTIEFLGREDFQVKVQGHRIELGEIEAALATHSAVRGAVVNAVGKPGGPRRLVAYVVPEAVPAKVLAQESSGESLAEAHEPDPRLGVISDPIERLEFKLKSPGVRVDLGHREAVALQRPVLDEAGLRRVLARKSHRKFRAGQVTSEQLGALLSCLMQVPLEDSVLPKYQYASAGGLYPVQVYLHVNPGRVAGLEGGAYYYHPKHHQLVLLSADVVLGRGQHAPGNRAVFDDAAFSLFLVGTLDAIQPLYGELSRDFCLLEAGYISQLLMSSAVGGELGLCPVGGLDFEPLRRQLDLREHHVLLHSLLGGGVEAVAAVARPHAKVGPGTSLAEALRQHLAAKLPDYMVPSTFVLLDTLPLTSNGKVDRDALRPPGEVPSVPLPGGRAPRTDMERSLAAILQEVLQLDEVDVHRNFFDLGGTSVQIMQMRRKLRERLGVDLPVAKMFRYTTVSALAEYLSSVGTAPPRGGPVVEVRQEAPRPVEAPVPDARPEPGLESAIAIVGMAGRFPGARNLAEFWRNLRDGVESVTFFTDAELRGSVLEPSQLDDPNYVRAGAVLEGVELFDAEHFGFTQKQARLTDPQHRIFMECVWEAIEDAGYDPKRLEKLVGVYAGSIISTYLLHHLGGRVGREGAVRDLQSLIGNDKDYLATHVSYRLGLKGPSVSVQTACSSSLVAVHLASQALRNRECDMALAGGVAVRLPQKSGYLFEPGAILSPDGHCRAFDADARGTHFGSGAGVVVLKRLKDALAEGDSIRAVIRGSAINNDGSMKAGYTAPSQEGQAAVIAAAMASAGVRPSSIGYIETHGTGTPLGDQIELSALQQAFGVESAREGTWPIGSVKTNVGHLEVAAGVAGLIKTVLSLQHRALPPSLNFKRPQADFANSPFVVNAGLAEWRRGGTPRRAGVSSFGIGGTNAHVVVEEAPEVERREEKEGRGVYVLGLSARNEKALRELAGKYAREAEGEVGDVCFTANEGRGSYGQRVAVVGRSLGELKEELRRYEKEGVVERGAVGQGKKVGGEEVVMLFTGQGVQTEGMGRELYESEETFREEMRKSDEVVRKETGESLVEVLYGGKGKLLERSGMAQAALFAVEYGLAQVWKKWGVKPAVVMGHSLGEYVAACEAGVFGREEGLKLVMERGRLMEGLGEVGRMVAVMCGEEEVRGEGGGGLIAAVNGPEEVVLSGREEEVEEVVGRLRRRGRESRRLKTTHAFHSELMEPMREELERAAGKVRMERGRVEWVSNVSGREVRGDEAREGRYWGRQLREPVRWWEGLRGLYEKGYRVFLEVGPKPTLTGMGKRSLGGAEWVWSLKSGKSDWEEMLGSAARLYVKGVEVKWGGMEEGRKRRRVPLPTYPFQREHFWIERPRQLERPASRLNARHGLLGRRIESPALKQTVFESFVSTSALAYLSDHRVFGATVLPSTVLMEMARAAAARLLGTGAHAVEDLRIHEALVLHGESERALQYLVSPVGADSFSFQVFSAPPEVADTTWKLHASGRLQRAAKDAAPPEPRAVETLLARCPKTVPAETLYAQYQSRGIHYGPTFRGVERIHLGKAEALGWIQQAEDLSTDAGDEGLHPALFDACLQVCGALFLEGAAGVPEGALYLPVAVKQVQVWREPGPACWSHVSVDPETSATDGAVTGNVCLLDASGSVCVEVKGLRFQQVSAPALQRLLGKGRDWTYEVGWEPRPPVDVPTSTARQSCWLVFCDAGGVGDAFARALEARGAWCARVRPGAVVGSRDGRTFTVDPSRVEDFTRLLEDVAAAGAPPCEGLAYLWGLDAGAPLTERSVCQGALHLSQCLASRGTAAPPRLWMVTRGVQRTKHEAFVPSVANAELWGLGRTLALEHPERWGALIDLDGVSREDEPARLMAELHQRPEGEEVAYRDGRRYVARLVRCLLPGDSRPPASRIHRDATYLVTGGLGALGLLVARWLVDQGARHLVLMGRSLAVDTSREVLGALEKAGAKVDCLRADVACPEDVARVLAAIAGSGHPLRGVVHAAGVVEDGTLQSLDWKRFERVLAPKLRGSWNLHEQTKGLPLDFFVLFSSSSSVLGAAGQGNYAAANAFMDALAHHRQALGLPAVSINWGPWSGGGMAASLEVPERRRWFDWIEPSHGLELLGQAMDSGRAQVAVLPIDWSKYVQHRSGLDAAGLLRNVLEVARAALPRGKAVPMLERLKGQLRNRQQETLFEHVHQQVAQVLGWDVAKPMPGGVRLFDAGLDSLLAVELRNRLQSSLGVERPLSTTLVFEHPSIDALTHHLATEVFSLGPLVVAPEPAPTGVDEAGVERLEQLPHEELGSMLDQKLAALEKWMGGE